MSTEMDHRQALSEWFNYRRLSNDNLREFNEQGYLVIGPVLTSRGLAHMRKQCMAAWYAEKDEFNPAGN